MRMKLCKRLGCKAMIPYDQTNPYCEKHRQDYHEYQRPSRSVDQRHYNLTRRDQEANQFYHTRAWRQLSLLVKRQAMMTCECCGHTALTKGKLLVDHVVPRRIDKRCQLDRDNLWVLCYSCHYWKTQLETQIYLDGEANFIANLDTATRWNQDAIRNWIIDKKANRFKAAYPSF
ncbi:HNH endonuclease [Lactiplantibacillus plantarum]|uniref:HNH endonuclease n=1 Tax=Lactiplantibacillus plantarum TaxID=1590 RepID=UPI0010810189|nr:HNH endonuclease signature motif containing protein [Lactiplantibacillus plantarum]QBX93945.1 HNH endonuclease [Lactiplantibacillus plantarum]